MSTITREQAKDLRNAFDCWQQDYDPVEDKEQYDMFGLAMVAMDALQASLEAEPVCVIDQTNLDYLKSGADADVWPASRAEMGDVLLYRAALPAPANADPVAWMWSHRKHPSEVTLVQPEDDERAEGAHWSGWSCQALYAEPVTTDYKLPDGWVACSERMPPLKTGVIVGKWIGRSWATKWATYIPSHPEANSHGFIMPGGSWEPTHWMPLPAAPQQEA
ncbi:DUF551 domain-containing protein [Enterobacter sp. EGD-HP1]|uniref:DUF551 domain-containing protein n=1 Tax=Enterobacter sp. EGD-HP1 TaxID=1357268 RepID=UPI0004DB4A32|nr:DUF551 domain-containing protein [Enterobacter sp. EGD-HP1]KFA86528.1 hypothetical protein N037_03185 [Enterobacter sp. EGD-HP1]